MKNKAYLVVMSRGESIPIDSDEIPNILTGIQNKAPVMLKQGIFNPSFFVSIVEDAKRKENAWEDIKYDTLKQDTYRELGIPKLRNIFEGIGDVMKRLGKG